MTTNINIVQTLWRLLSAVSTSIISLVVWLGYMALGIVGEVGELPHRTHRGGEGTGTTGRNPSVSARATQQDAKPRHCQAHPTESSKRSTTTIFIRYVTMKPRTKYQKQVVTSAKGLRPIKGEQTKWAFRECLDHYAFQLKHGQTTASKR